MRSNKTAIGTLTEDAKVSKEGFVHLSYSTSYNNWAGSALPVDKCPPVEQLKKGVKIRVTYRDILGMGGIIEKIRIAS